ncbi:MAG: hypothetical protein QXW98_04585 [Candidatus Caldarchaeum sp.]
MPWIKNIITNPSSGQVLIRFRVSTTGTPTNIIGLTGIYVSSTAIAQIAVRRKNYAETQTYDNVWRVVCPANDTRYIIVVDDPLVPYIGLPEAGTYEIVEIYSVTGITGTVFVAVQIFGGPTDVDIGSVF